MAKKTLLYLDKVRGTLRKNPFAFIILSILLVFVPSRLFNVMSENLSGFPTLKPAIITKVNIGDVHDLGKWTQPLISSVFSHL